MHDPMTVAFQIKRPWPQARIGTSPRYWPPLATIWHVDPETDGSDDSCGWSRPKVPRRIAIELELWAKDEARRPWLLAAPRKRPNPADAECLLRGLIVEMARLCRLGWPLQRAERLAVELLHRPYDNLASLLCFIPGWHSNNEEDAEKDRERCAIHLLYCVARAVLGEARPWWRQPRWHFWHWRVQIHPIQNLKRWLFTRCEACGQRFGWGYCPVSYDRVGPRWFRGEQRTFHHECHR